MTSRSPLVNRLAVVIGAIVLTAIVSMATALAVSNSIEGNATAINLAGSLRMGAFQLAARSASEDPVENTDTLDQRIEEYEDRLRDPAIIRSIPRTDDHPLVEQYKTVEYGWANQLRPSLESHQTGAPLSAEMITTVESYTVEVDRLVSMLEQRTEARIDLLHLIQIISMVFSVLIVLALFLDLKTAFSGRCGNWWALPPPWANRISATKPISKAPMSWHNWARPLTR